jgi:ubiquinone/menaquinone biosynthesis C-methylase UbiE
MTRFATRLAADEQLGDRVRFETGDSLALTCLPESFDAIIAHTLFSHIDDPAKALAEMHRVLRPGGVIGIFDGDYASLTFELEEPERSCQFDDAIIRSLVTNPRVLRQMPRLLRQAGFVVEALLPSVVTEIGAAKFWKGGIEAYARLAPRAGVLDQAAATKWLEELAAISERGDFFGSCVYYAYIARRPA